MTDCPRCGALRLIEQEHRWIVEYIKSGDGSFFPVETTGGEEWRDEDVWCV